jgi:pimeloyl-ACP methyl ester carboxylesterase
MPANKEALPIKSNSPLQNPPADYFPLGSGNWFEIPEGLDAGKQQFYYDHCKGSGDPEATVVFVHGNPECSYTYRHIRDALMASAHNVRLIAMDHIGFGLSDQATFEMVEMHHSANLIQLVRHLDLQDVTLVVHDWGGPIGVGTFMQEHWRVKNLLVMNTTVFPMPSDGFTYENFPITWLPWCKTPRVIPDSLWGGVAAYVVSNGSPQRTFGFLTNTLWSCLKHGLRMFPEGSQEYVWSQMLRSKANARSSKRNVLQTPYWGNGWSYEDPTHGTQDNREYYARMHRDVPAEWGPEGRNIPVCGYFGHWDACGKQSVIRQWQDALPNMVGNTFEFPDIGHFIEEYKGPEMAESILAMNELSAN